MKRDPKLLLRGRSPLGPLALEIDAELITPLDDERAQLEQLLRNLKEQIEASRGREAFIKELGKFVAGKPCWVSLPKELIPHCAPGPTLEQWLHIREQLQAFYTGDRVIFRDMFEIPEELLGSTEWIPSYRPSKASHSDMLLWMRKVGRSIPESPSGIERKEILQYGDAWGSDEPQLCLLRRSRHPDTLGQKSPEDLAGQAWAGFFEILDSNTLHFSITGEDLAEEDSTTLLLPSLYSKMVGSWSNEQKPVNYMPIFGLNYWGTFLGSLVWDDKTFAKYKESAGWGYRSIRKLKLK